MSQTNEPDDHLPNSDFDDDFRSLGLGLGDEEGEDLSDFNAVDRGYLSVERSERARGSSTLGDTGNSINTKLLRRAAKLDREKQQAMDEPAEVGVRGFLNTLGLSLQPSVPEVEARMKKYQKAERRLYIGAVRAVDQRIGKSSLNINSALNASGQIEKWVAPSVSVFAGKGGCGKTTVISALAQSFAISLMRHHEERFKGHLTTFPDMPPVVVADINPDIGTLSRRLPPNTRVDIGSEASMNTLELAGAIQANRLTVPSVDITTKTKWPFLRYIQQPSAMMERHAIRKSHVEAIYDSMKSDVSLFLMDNGPNMTSEHIRASMALSNACVQVVDTTVPDFGTFTIGMIQEFDQMAREDESFRHLSDRLVVVLNVRNGHRRTYEEARDWAKHLHSRRVRTVLLPYDEMLDNNGDSFELTKLGPEFRAGIASIQDYMLDNLVQGY